MPTPRWRRSTRPSCPPSATRSGSCWCRRRCTRTSGSTAAPEGEAFDELILHVDGYLCELKDAQIRGGLHVLGQPPVDAAELDLVLAMTRLPQAASVTGPVPSLRATVASRLGVDLEAGASSSRAPHTECGFVTGKGDESGPEGHRAGSEVQGGVFSLREPDTECGSVAGKRAGVDAVEAECRALLARLPGGGVELRR